MAGRYAELYRRTRETLEAEAEAQLQRPLTPHERNLFRSCGTLTMLENLGMTIYYAQNAEELATSFAETSMESRFLLAVKETADRLERLLERSLTANELQQLHALEHTEALWWLEEHVLSAPLHQRETVLQHALSTPIAR